MAILVFHPELEAEIRRIRPRFGNPDRDQEWEGVTVVSPEANNLHQRLQTDLLMALYAAVGPAGRVFGSVNISDRAAGWDKNYRSADVTVYLATNPAIDHDTHFEGGPDFLVEILSPGEVPEAKFDFYAKIGTREVLLVNRRPWAVELFRLTDGVLAPAGRSDDQSPAAVASAALGVTFAVVPGDPRTVVAVADPATGRTWRA